MNRIPSTLRSQFPQLPAPPRRNNRQRHLARSIFRFAAVAILLAGISVPALAYKLVLKDGQEIDTVEPYRIEGDRAVFTLASGTQSSIALSEVDVQKTREANERDLGTAVVINRDGTSGSYDPEANSRQQTRTLQRLLRERERERAAQSEPEESEVDLPSVVRQTAGGNDDLLSLERRVPLDGDLGRRLDSELRKAGAGNFSVYQGSKADRLFVEWTIRSEDDLMDSLPRSARAILASIQSSSLDAVELLFVTSSRQRAGQFLIDLGGAETLSSGSVSAAEFYIAFVQF